MTTQTAEQLAAEMQRYGVVTMNRWATDGAAMLRSQAAEIERLKDKHDRLKKMVDDGSVNGRMYSTALEQEAEIERLRTAMTTLLANPTSKLMQNIARAALEKQA